MKTSAALIQSTTMLSSLATVVARSTNAAFVARSSSRSFTAATALRAAKAGQAEVVLVGCGAPNRGTIVCSVKKRSKSRRCRVYRLLCVQTEGRAVFESQPADENSADTAVRRDITVILMTLGFLSATQEWDGTTPCKCSMKSKLHSNAPKSKDLFGCRPKFLFDSLAGLKSEHCLIFETSWYLTLYLLILGAHQHHWTT
jgi:hypothetical protein